MVKLKLKSLLPNQLKVTKIQSMISFLNFSLFSQLSQKFVIVNTIVIGVVPWKIYVLIFEKNEKMTSNFRFMSPFYPSKPTRRQQPKAVGGTSKSSERGRSALFKNSLFFSCKFLGCYIEAAQNFFMYVPFSWQIGHKKITLLNWF